MLTISAIRAIDAHMLMMLAFFAISGLTCVLHQALYRIGPHGVTSFFTSLLVAHLKWGYYVQLITKIFTASACLAAALLSDSSEQATYISIVISALLYSTTDLTYAWINWFRGRRRRIHRLRLERAVLNTAP